MQRKLCAILAADVVGYSALMERDEQGTFDRLRVRREQLFEPQIKAHHGRIFKLLGDGLLAEFGSVVDAVQCAVVLQREMVRCNASLPEGNRLNFRIGINLGDVIVDGKDRYGDGVNVAARLEQICEPGGVTISGTSYDQLQGKVDVPLEFVGEQRVKNISRPVRAYRIQFETAPAPRARSTAKARWVGLILATLVVLALAGGATWWFWADKLPSVKPAVAVLPFNNFGGDDATRRLADGLTEDIITDLARFPEFQVIARNSTDTYRGRPTDARQVGTALQVGYVLEGSIQREGNRVRITAQLIDANSGTHLWAEQWDRPDEDVFAIQTEISDKVANRLGGGAGLIQEAGRIAAHRKPPNSLTAYELYLLGTEKLEQVNRADTEDAIKLLNRAVEIDPQLARAWVELYQAHQAHSVLAGFGIAPENNRRIAADAAERAVMLDPSDAEAHAVLGMSYGDKNDFVRAKAELDAALRLAPGATEILTFYIGWASTFGEPQRGADMVDRVIRLDPNYPMWTARPFSYAYFMAGRYEDTLRMMERLVPDNYGEWLWAIRAGALAALGRTEEAKNTVKEALKSFPDLTIEGVAYQPGYSDSERTRLIDTMRLAGFPPCAKPETLAKGAKPARLPECEARP